jgi:uncharacterized protein
MDYGLKEKTVSAIKTVFGNYPELEKVILYGSRAKGNYKNGSDIDLTLIGNDLNLSLINKIELDLDDLFLPYTFDISIMHQISNHNLIEHIKRVGKVFYQKKLE